MSGQLNPWQLDRADDDVFTTMTREEYYRLRNAARRMVTPGLEGLAQLADPPPKPAPPAKSGRGRRATPAPAPKRGRRT